ncbi:DUF7919 family protein [Streptomyces gossypiisoli]
MRPIPGERGLWRDNGEIRIPGEPDIAYAAPVLITHHVAAHGYRLRQRVPGRGDRGTRVGVK